MDQNFWIHLKDDFIDLLLHIGPRVIYAIIAFMIGMFAIKILMRSLKKLLSKSKTELSLQTFIESLSVFILWGVLIFIIGSIIGIKASSFFAIFGAAGIAIGLALQGSLSNFAGGVLILVFKPFKVGDLIEVNGVLGFVQQIDILYTRVKTYDGRIVTMPNGNLSNSDVDNRSMNPYRRVELDLKFHYSEDMGRIREILLRTLNKHPDILKDPAPDAWLDKIGEYHLIVTSRCWTKSDIFWDVYWDQLEAVKKALDEEGIEIPIPKQKIEANQFQTEIVSHEKQK